MYADIHCYPGKVAYDTSFMALNGYDGDPSDPWQIPQSNLNEQVKSKPAKDYSQCDLVKSTQARVKLMFASLYPIEKGFFHGIKGSQTSKKIISDYFEQIQIDGEKPATEWLAHQLSQQPYAANIKKSEIDSLLNRFKRLPIERIKFLQNGSYDYFEELKREYKFYLSKAGQKATTPNKLQLEPHGPTRKWDGVYQLAQSGSDVLYRLRPDNDDVVIVLTIEGIHSLGIGNPEDESLSTHEKSKDVSVGKIKSRIRQLKGEESLDDATLRKWNHCPFYITFAQHFNNTLCGHAHSLPFISTLLYDQNKGMNKGILRNCTYSIFKELLGLDDNLVSTGSKRILIDVKQMSAASRQDYYKNIIRPYNRKPENSLSKIPVIASQVAYSGIDELETLTTNANSGKEDDNFQHNGFKAWNINLSDEDVIEIHQSEGLIGISLDEQLLGHFQKSWLADLHLPMIERKRAKNLLARTIQQFVSIPFNYHLESPKRIWDILSIGTGFDGASRPLNGYSTVLDLHRLEDDLIGILGSLKKQKPSWFEEYDIENLARKICFENAYEFVIKHYH